MVKQLMDDLRSLGIKHGSHVLVHSSLRSLGDFTDKAPILKEALLQVLGREGTLLVPSLSYKTVTKDQPLFDVRETPSCVGGFSEFFRNEPGVFRSIHPTHSVCAYGSLSKPLTEAHLEDDSPVGPNSPFHLLRKHGGYLLFIGCGLKPNTSMHGVEELSRPPYLFGKETEYELKLWSGEILRKKYIIHGFQGYIQRYDRVWDLLEKEDKSQGRLLNADSYLMKAAPMWDKAHEQLLQDPLYFVDKE